MPLVLRPRAGAAPIADLTGITPDRLAACGAAEAHRLPISADGRRAELGSCFVLSGEAHDAPLECEGDFSRVDGLGAGLARGTIRVGGPVGRHAGAGMTGGTLEIAGAAGDWLGVGMAGGMIHVQGDAGDDVAAATPGAAAVTGGLVLVEGSVGIRAAARMRRGILAVGGNCGEGAALDLHAGTLIVFGRLGGDAGVGMRRGTLVAAGPADPPGPWFLPGATWEPAILRLIGRHLVRAGFRAAGLSASEPLAGRWCQWHGDACSGGRGEFFRREGG